MTVAFVEIVAFQSEELDYGGNSNLIWIFKVMKSQLARANYGSKGGEAFKTHKSSLNPN